jgi:hypothetical protein
MSSDELCILALKSRRNRSAIPLLPGLTTTPSPSSTLPYSARSSEDSSSALAPPISMCFFVLGHYSVVLNDFVPVLEEQWSTEGN